MKKILITGVNKGLGKILAEYFSKNGFFVYGTARKLHGLNEIDKVKYVYMDLQDLPSISNAVELVLEDAGTIDAVIHNAGIAYLDPTDVMADEERRHIFEVNFFGPINLTEKFLPHFRSLNRGKLIFISSIVSLDHWPSLGMYAASKAALECVAFEWAVLLKKWNIDVSIIRANPLPTDMQILKSKNSALSIYGNVFCNELVWEKTEDICNIIMKILNSSSPNFDFSSGEFSQKTVDSILKHGIYQDLVQMYRKKLNI